MVMLQFLEPTTQKAQEQMDRFFWCVETEMEDATRAAMTGSPYLVASFPLSHI